MSVHPSWSPAAYVPTLLIAAAVAANYDFHIVFALPHELLALVLQNKRLLYDLLFRASAAALPEVTRDPDLLHQSRPAPIAPEPT